MPALPTAIANWINGNKTDAMRQFVRLSRSDQEQFAAAVLDSPQAIVGAILLGTLTVTPAEAASNESAEANAREL